MIFNFTRSRATCPDDELVTILRITLGRERRRLRCTLPLRQLAGASPSGWRGAQVPPLQARRPAAVARRSALARTRARAGIVGRRGEEESRMRRVLAPLLVVALGLPSSRAMAAGTEDRIRMLEQ